MAAVTFDPIVPLLLGLLIGLLLSLVVGSWWSTRRHPHYLSWLTTHDWVMCVLLILAAFTGGVFIAFVLLR